MGLGNVGNRHEARHGSCRGVRGRKHHARVNLIRDHRNAKAVGERQQGPDVRPAKIASARVGRVGHQEGLHLEAVLHVEGLQRGQISLPLVLCDARIEHGADTSILRDHVVQAEARLGQQNDVSCIAERDDGQLKRLRGPAREDDVVGGEALLRRRSEVRRPVSRDRLPPGQAAVALKIPIELSRAHRFLYRRNRVGWREQIAVQSGVADAKAEHGTRD